MEARVRDFKRLVLMSLGGAISAEDVAGLARELTSAYKEASHVVAIAGSEAMAAGVPELLLKLRDVLKKSGKLRLVLVCAGLEGADAADLAGGLKVAGSPDAVRVAQLLEKESERARLREKSADLKRQIGMALGLAAEFTSEELEAALGALRTRHQALKVQARTVGSEVTKLKKQEAAARAPASPELERRFAELKAKVLGIPVG